MTTLLHIRSLNLIVDEKEIKSISTLGNYYFKFSIINFLNMMKIETILKLPLA